jgi:hypothetical protein
VDESIIILTITIDDNLALGYKIAVPKTMEDIGKNFEIKRSQGINNFIGYKIRREGGIKYFSLKKLINKI